MPTINLPEPNVKVIGPQLGLPNEPHSIIITIGLPHFPSDAVIECILEGEDGSRQTQKKECLDKKFKNFVFKFSNLKPGTPYRYLFKDAHNTPIPLEGDLTTKDCWFYGPDFDDRNDKFVLLSCNNPFMSGFSTPEQQFRMWQKLHDAIMPRQDIKFILQGGDQVYNDVIADGLLQTLKGSDLQQEIYDNATNIIITNYQSYYSNLYYRKILAHIPSAAMLDDHDITDGWGGRPDSFVEGGKVFLDEWNRYFQLTYEAFRAYQACKNPDPICDDAATTFVDLGDNRIFLMDFRKQKNTAEEKLIGNVHEQKVHEIIEGTNKRTFVLSPVVPVRMDPKAEAAFERAAKLAYKLSKSLQNSHDVRVNSAISGFRRWCYKIALKLLTGTADYEDDIGDSLSSSTNKSYLLRLIKLLYDNHQKNGGQIIILSGDIHTGGISEIIINKGDLVIPQIVSSPIGYKPMPKEAKDFTMTEGEPSLSDGEIIVDFRNIFYRSARNFAIIAPSKLAEASGIEFYFENLSQPICCPAYYQPQESLEILERVGPSNQNLSMPPAKAS